jgi:hypothetical protein
LPAGEDVARELFAICKRIVKSEEAAYAGFPQYAVESRQNERVVGLEKALARDYRYNPAFVTSRSSSVGPEFSPFAATLWSVLTSR